MTIEQEVLFEKPVEEEPEEVSPHDRWQNAALKAFLESGPNFLCAVSFAAGKTRYGCRAAQALFQNVEIDFVVIVVPREPLKDDWSDEAHRYGVDVANSLENSLPLRISSEAQGVVITYQQLANGIGVEVIKMLMARFQRVFVIFDEIHHCGESENSRWGGAIEAAFGNANPKIVRRLCLSATPFRTEGSRVSFLTYGGEDGELVIPDYEYSYAKAAADHVVRSVVFNAQDGPATWLELNGETETSLVSAAAEYDEGIATRTLRLPDGKWIEDVFHKADKELTLQRELIPDMGGLIIAERVQEAYAYAKRLRKIVGPDQVTVVASKKDEEQAWNNSTEAKQLINQFRIGDTRWIISPNMISEGINIPRLGVLIYCSAKRTKLYFLQAIGRIVRVRDERWFDPAVVFIPSSRTFLDLAIEIMEELNRERKIKKPRVPPGPGPWEPPTYRTPVSSGEASLHSLIADGESYSANHVKLGQELRSMHPSLANLPDVAVAMIAQRFDGDSIRTSEPISVPGKSRPNKRSDLIALVNKAMKSLIYAITNEHNGPVYQAEIKRQTTELNKMFREDNIYAGTVETLSQRLLEIQKRRRAVGK